MLTHTLYKDRKLRALPQSIKMHVLPGYAFPGIPTPQFMETCALTNQLLNNEWRSRKQIESQQFRQLRSLLLFAEKQSPFYAERMRSHGINPKALRSLDDFRRIPPLTRKDLQDKFDLIRAKVLPPGSHKGGLLSTSGSTGSPVQVQSTSVTKALWNACCLRDYLWSNVDPRGRFLSLRHFSENVTEALNPEGGHRQGWGGPMGQLFTTGPGAFMNVGMDPKYQFSFLMRENPDYILSYPSNLELLGNMLSEARGKLSRLKQIHTIGEILTDHKRQNIQDSFGVRVCDLYSAVEVGYIASQCPEGHGYHIHDENVLVEVVNDDGSPCPSGEIGKVYLTGLIHYGLPLIRYDVGDYAIETDKPCPCGRGLSRLLHVIGRQRGQLIRPDGSIMFSSGLSVALRDVNSIRQYQVIQHKRNCVEVIIVPSRNFGPAQEQHIVETFEKQFGCPINVSINLVDHIDRTPGGKYLDFICKTK